MEALRQQPYFLTILKPERQQPMLCEPGQIRYVTQKDLFKNEQTGISLPLKRTGGVTINLDQVLGFNSK